MNKQKKSRDDVQPLSSVILQSQLYFDALYQYLFFFVEGLIFFYKGYTLFYPSGALEQDIVILIAFAVLQLFRIQMGSAGNKTETCSHMCWFIIVLFPAVVIYFYFLFLQTYILMIEVILSIIGIVFIFFELITSIFAGAGFRSFEKQSYQ